MTSFWDHALMAGYVAQVGCVARAVSLLRILRLVTRTEAGPVTGCYDKSQVWCHYSARRTA